MSSIAPRLGPTFAQNIKTTVLVALSTAGVACGMTLLYLGMRSVMAIGGSCAEGGPFVSVRPCPEGAPGALIGGVWIGIIFAGIYAWQAFSNHIPNFIGFLWPALFLSLGWNFFDFGINAPGGQGLVWGWLICGIVFALMGGLPLLIVIPATINSIKGKTPGVGSRAGSPLSALSIARKVSPSARGNRPSVDDIVGKVTTSDDIVSNLERLDKLYRSGALDAQQYQAAKQKVIGT